MHSPEEDAAISSLGPPAWLGSSVIRGSVIRSIGRSGQCHDSLVAVEATVVYHRTATTDSLLGLLSETTSETSSTGKIKVVLQGGWLASMADIVEPE